MRRHDKKGVDYLDVWNKLRQIENKIDNLEVRLRREIDYLTKVVRILERNELDTSQNFKDGPCSTI